ncbi:MAG: DNA/RNA non-specific endonuclease [Gammaproteobacteria bacterium]|nr:DNA/RNA non-specific endonuclease [Gammaproteobacteria bacterium]MBU1447836.1 DNA/RNA non-specific endonuclease [Gammaproteobacteria bacterium]
MQRLIFALVFAVSLALAPHASAGQDDFEQCRQVFAHGEPPHIQKQAAQKLRALCFSAFAVLHSGQSRTPVYVAERLNRQTLQAAHEKRKDKFFADARLPRAERAELDDYKGSGYDRGHMAPAADMTTPESMAQSFSLANMVPQAPENNRKVWAKIEKSTRKYVMRAQGDVYVISGPAFTATPPTIGGNHVWVPRHLFKLVYDPSANKAWAHWIDNQDTAKAGQPISYQELVKRTGISFLPNYRGS